MKYWPILLKDIKTLKRSYLILEMIFFPLIGLAMFGLFTTFIEASFTIKTFLFSGIIGWTIIQISQHAVGRGFLIEIWERSLKQTLTAPITLHHFIIGHWLYGVFAASVGFLITTGAAYAFFDFNFFSLGIYIPFIILLGVLTGLIIGILVISVILALGLKVDLLVFTLVEVIVFFSGVYYSVAVFPEAIQAISQGFPAIYMFEVSRTVLTGEPAGIILLKGFIVASIWIAIALALINKIDRYAKRTGFYQKYG